MSGPPRGSWAAKLLLAACSFVVALAAVEVGFRLFSPELNRQATEQVDPILGRVKAPGKKLIYAKRDAVNVYDTNSEGFYDLERTRHKPPGGFRIAAIGDSFVDAVQVPLEQTMTRTLERLLKAQHGPGYEVLNFGRGGTSFAEYFLILKHWVLAYDPDVVLLFVYNENDFDEIRSRSVQRTKDGIPLRPVWRLEGDSLVAVPYQTPGIPPPKRIRLHSLAFITQIVYENPRLLTLLVKAGVVDSRHLYSRGVLVGGAGYPDLYNIYAGSMEVEWEEAFRLGERLILEIRRRCEAKGVRFGLVSIPSEFEVHPDLLAKLLETYPSMKGKRWDFAKVSALLEGFARRSRIPFLRLDHPFIEYTQAHPGQLLYFKYNGHWNALGNRLAAEAVARFVQNGSLLDRQAQAEVGEHS